MNEYRGELVRDEGGFALAAHDGHFYSLELPRVPVDLFGKNVVVTGSCNDDSDHIVAEFIRSSESD